MLGRKEPGKTFSLGLAQESTGQTEGEGVTLGLGVIPALWGL